MQKWIRVSSGEGRERAVGRAGASTGDFGNGDLFVHAGEGRWVEVLWHTAISLPFLHR